MWQLSPSWAHQTLTVGCPARCPHCTATMLMWLTLNWWDDESFCPPPSGGGQNHTWATMIWPVGTVSFHRSLEVKERVASLPSCSFSLFVFSLCPDGQIWSLFKINFQPLFKLLEKHGGFLWFFQRFMWTGQNQSLGNEPFRLPIPLKKKKKRETEIT